MSRWVAIFDDTSDMLGVRKQNGAKHLEYLEANKGKILIGGGLRNAPDQPFVGGLWILEVDNREEAVRLIENDPYYHPKFRAYRLLIWGKALENTVVTL